MATGWYERFTGMSAQQRRDFAARAVKDPVLAAQLRLSEAQRRMWFLERLTSGTALYNLPSAYRFRGPLNARALRSAVVELTQRHEMLRMRYVDVLGDPLQLPSGEPFDCAYLDLSGLAPAEREAEVRRRTEADARTPFTLLGGPLARAAVLRLAEDDHALLLNLHHSIADGWSLGLLFDQLETLYEEQLHGLPGTPPEPVNRYLDHAARQRAWLESDAAERSVGWWREELADAPVELALPTDEMDSAPPPGAGAVVSRTVSAELTEALRALGRTEAATLFMVLLAAYGVLLRRRSGQSDLVVGSPASGRDHPDTADTVGLYVNTTVFRIRIDGAAPFRELLAAVRRTALGVYAHQDLPFDWLVDRLDVRRVPGRNPLFSAFLSVEPFSERPVRIGGLTGENIEAHAASAWFDVSFWVGECLDGTLRLDLTYAARRFSPATAEALVDEFLGLLDTLVREPRGRVLDELAPPTAPVRSSLPAPLLPLPPVEGGRHTAPVALRQVVAETWAELLGIPELAPQDDFFDKGGRSLIALQAVARLNEMCGTDIHPAELFEASTVEDFAQLLAGVDAPRLTGLRTVRAGTGPGVVLLPPVGGDVLCYTGLAMALETERPVYAAAMPGLYDGRRPLSSIPELASHYLSLLRLEEVRGPTTLIGWSLGGAIALDMAVRLWEDGSGTPEVILIDSPAPGWDDGEPEEADLVEEFTSYLAAAAGRDGSVTARECPDEESLVAWAREHEVIGDSPAERQFLVALGAVFRANRSALADHAIPAYPGRVLYLAAVEDAADRRWHRWQSALGASLEVRQVPGDHFSMMTRPHVAAAAKEIGTWWGK